MLPEFLNIFAPIAISIFIGGIILKLGRIGRIALTQQPSQGVTQLFEGAPPRQSMRKSLRAVLINPIKHFYRRANPNWGFGYALYHIAFITEFIGYSIAGIIVISAVIMGHPVPDVANHITQSYNYEPANLLALIFGNGETLQANYLFGSWGSWFIGFTWIAVLLAVIGNFNLLFTLIRRRHTAVINDIDPAASGLRINGRFTWDRLIIRVMIFCIIWTELFARLNLIPGIVFIHAALGLIFFTLLPFTYLFHIIYGIIAVIFATRRRMLGTIA